MDALPPDTVVVHTHTSTTYHRLDESGNTVTACGAGIVSPSRSEVRHLPWYEPCSTCFPNADDDLEQSTLDE